MKTRQYIQLDRPVVDNLLTTGDAYVIVPFNIDRTEETRNYWDAWHLTGVKVLLFSATTKDLKVKILGSLDGLTFSQTVEAEFTVTTSAIVEKRITAYWPYLQIQVKPAAAGQNGTLSVQAMGTTFSSEVDTEISAVLDPTGLATEATLADLLAKIIAAPSTEAKQDLILTALGLIATEATAGDIKTAAESIAVATPDTAAGDFASMSADLGSIDSKLAASTINEYAVTLTVVDTEYSQALPANTKGIEFVSRSGYPVRYAFTTGKVATPTGVYFTLKSNCSYESPATLNLSSKTIYFASDNAGDVVELIAWS